MKIVCISKACGAVRSSLESHNHQRDARTVKTTSAVEHTKERGKRKTGKERKRKRERKKEKNETCLYSGGGRRRRHHSLLKLCEYVQRWR